MTKKTKKKENKIANAIKQYTSKIDLGQNKFNTLELLLIFIMALLLGIVAGEMIFSGKDGETISISKKINKNISEIENVYNTLLDEYIDKIDEEKLKTAAINGMMGILEDNFSSYYDKESEENLREELEGYFYGLGMEIYRDNDGHIIINNVFENSPAEKAGLKKGDEYLKIDDINVEDKPISEIAKLIKGTKDKTYTITVKRNKEEIRETIKTGKVEIPSVKSEIIEQNNEKIGYINISIFANNTDEQFEKHLKKLEEQNIKKLIIDVRSNSGGSLETVINIGSNFLKKDDVIVQTVLNNKITKKYSVKNSENKYEIVVLIDEASASGAEVLASSLNENLKAELVGVTTYGKGTVQKIKKLPGGGAIKYTTETWITSKGKEINEIGIKPTIEVKINEKYYKTLDKKDDNQLQKAIEILLQQ